MSAGERTVNRGEKVQNLYLCKGGRSQVPALLMLISITMNTITMHNIIM